MRPLPAAQSLFLAGFAALLGGCGSTPDPLAKLSLPTMPVLAPAAPVVAPRPAEDARISLKLTSTVKLPERLSRANLLVLVGSEQGPAQSVVINAESPVEIPIQFSRYSLRTETVHLALKYDEAAFPLLWEKSLTIQRGQQLSLTEPVAFLALPSNLMASDGLPGKKLSPQIFYKGEPVVITFGRMENVAGPVEGERHFRILSLNPKGRESELSVGAIICELITSTHAKRQEIFAEQVERVSKTLRLTQSQATILSVLRRKAELDYEQETKSNSLSEENLVDKLTQLQVRIDKAFRNSLSPEQDALCQEAYIRANSLDRNPPVKLAGLAAYEAIKAVKMADQAKIEARVISSAAEESVSFVPQKTGEYRAVIWSEQNGQYAFSSLSFNVYERL